MSNEKAKIKNDDKVVALENFYKACQAIAPFKELTKTDRNMLNKVYANLKGRIQQISIFD